MNYRPKLIVLLFLSLLLVPFQLSAQDATPGPKLNTRFIPDSACAAITIFPEAMLKQDWAKDLPYEIGSALSKDQLGVDLTTATQITLFAETVKDMDSLQSSPPSWAGVVHFAGKQKFGGKGTVDLQESPNDPRLFLGEERFGFPSVLMLDDKTLLIGSQKLMAKMETAKGESKFCKSMRERVDGAGSAHMVMDVAQLRGLLNQMAQLIPRQAPPAVRRLAELPELIQTCEVELDFAAEAGELKFTTNDPDAAARTKKVIVKAISLGADLGVGMMFTQFDTKDPVQMATLQYTERMSETMQKRYEPQVEGNDVSVKFEDMSGGATLTVPVLVGMLLPAVQAVRAAARRTTGLNNLRQISLASLNYESAYQKFPAPANYDEAGKPLLSWRVHMLPYLEQGELYKKFRLDEPWDSDHNKKLIPLMPAAYDCPAVALPEGYTVYLGNAGPKGILQKKQIDFGKITDGSSNTVSFVEADASLSVQWTKPADLKVDESNPLAGLGNVHVGGFNVSFADGSTRFISRDVSKTVWLDLLNISDGNAVRIP